jgi:hypothetical protein
MKKQQRKPPAGMARTPKEDAMTRHRHLEALEQRYRHGYTWRSCEGEVTLALLGGQPRTYRDVMLLTRTAEHPHSAPPVVVLARNDYALAVVELFDLPDTDPAVIDLDAERDRRRGINVGEEA